MQQQCLGFGEHQNQHMWLGLNNDSNSILGKSNLCCTKLLTGILYPKMNLPKTQFTLITCYLFEVAWKLGLVRSDHRLLAVDTHFTWTKKSWKPCGFLKPQSKRRHFIHSGNMRPVNVHGDIFFHQANKSLLNARCLLWHEAIPTTHASIACVSQTTRIYTKGWRQHGFQMFLPAVSCPAIWNSSGTLVIKILILRTNCGRTGNLFNVLRRLFYATPFLIIYSNIAAMTTFL